MSRRPPAVRAALTATGLLAVAALSIATLAGCASKTPSAAPTGGSTSTGSTPSATPKPSPTPTFVDKPYTCTSILPPATLAVFQGKASAGFTLQKDYVERVRNFSPDLAQFADWGGILCQWAYPNTQNSVDYGYSTITDAQATTEQAMLVKNGYVESDQDHGDEYVNTDLTDYPDVYLFFDGHWVYASTSPLLGLIVDNIFQSSAQ